MAMTLEELKAENAKAEAEESANPQTAEEEVEEEAVEEESEESEEVAEPEEEEAEESETEAWMQGDDQVPDAEKKFTDSDVAAAKRKLRAKLEKKDDELAELKAKIQKLEAGIPAQQPGQSPRPKREDFDDHDDPDDAYIDALTDWKLQNAQAKQSAQIASEQTAQQQKAAQEAVSQSVDQHYERAVDLAEKSGISPEMYQAADLRVRQMVESVFPGAGDPITDALIANLGEGSERVFYNLGVNSARLAELKNRITLDPSGVKAAMYLGELNAELKLPQKRKTRAPKPATNITGDEQSGNTFRALKKKYDEAHKTGNNQAAFNARMEAKRAGANVSNW